MQEARGGEAPADLQGSVGAVGARGQPVDSAGPRRTGGRRSVGAGGAETGRPRGVRS